MFPSLNRTPQGLSLPALTAALVVVSYSSLPAYAAATDIAAYPLATTSAVQAKPNLLFILDDSGSMDSDYMPDDMRATIRISGTNYYTYGYRSAQCNGVAYDPSITYEPPKKADGTSYPNASFSAARDDGYDSSSTTYNLENYYYYRYTGSQPKMGWQYTASGLVSTSDFVRECRSPISWSPGASVFTTVTVKSTSTEAQNYANWFSYYRKRYLLMRSAMGHAVAGLGSGHRVGFSTISDTTATDGTNYFRDVKDFDATQKSNFYSSLYGSSPNSWTPLRGALSKAGRYFAKKASGQTYDPMQYSCQRNYALLSTDGYWNANDEDSSYGPYQLTSNTGVGNTDATESRPMFDGSEVVVTTVDTSTATGYRTKISSEQKRSQFWTRSSYTTSSTKGSGGCSSKRYLRTTTTQTYEQQQKRKTRDEQQATYTKTVTTVTTDGVVTSGPTTNISIGPWVLKTGTSQEYFDTHDDGAPTASTSWTTSVTESCVSSTGSSPMSAATSSGWSSWDTPTYSYTPSENPTLLAAAFSTPTTTSSTTYNNGSSDSLADVAQYYWATDLRDSTLGNCTSSSSGASRDVCNNIVRPNSSDTNTKQHMNTFTIGLGVSGTITYDKNYPTQTSGEFVDLKTGALNWPVPGDGLGAVNIDDLWHAAVNGRGRYYSALNATELADAISGVVTSIDATPGAAAAAATSTLELVAGDNNKLFSAKYTTSQWIGDLEAYSIDGQANISSTKIWSAKEKLDAMSYGSRKIYFKGASGLTAFEYGNLSATQKGYFDNFCNKDINPDLAGTQAPDQCATLGTKLAAANSGTNLVNYLRGDTSMEASHYRDRVSVLGDIINGAPVFVGKPPFNYSDDGYADFATANKSRKPVVYVAANDGMLHAFSAADSDGGTELWAYIPSDVMPNLYKLADEGYSLRHQYYVDGAPVMADVKIDGVWKTIVVGGLNKGGRSYYALDITNPTEPKTLWEFTDTNMGLTYGNPVITKNKDGKWVVAFTSGYNNHTTGDGKGYFYMVDAGTGVSVLEDSVGAPLTRLSTTEGSTTTPSGLSKINAWIDSTTDNTAKHFYGGDMLGNVWRFDPDGRYKSDSLGNPSPNITKIAKLQIDSSTPQPITTKPVTALVSDQPVVVIGTGRYLGDSDITDTTKQSIYAIRDTLSTTGWGDVRSDTSNFVKQTLTLNNTTTPSAATSASITSEKVDWTKGGWWFDLPQSGERVAINMGLQLNTLAIGTAIPNGDACASGGSSWRYYIGVGTGSSVAGSDAGVRWNPNTLIVGISWVKDADGNVRTIFQDSKGELKTEVPPTTSGSSGGTAHRTSWRELVD